MASLNRPSTLLALLPTNPARALGPTRCQARFATAGVHHRSTRPAVRQPKWTHRISRTSWCEHSLRRTPANRFLTAPTVRSSSI